MSYDLTTSQWYNSSLIGDVFRQPCFEGHLFFTEIAGASGILIALGVSTDVVGADSSPLDLQNLYIYDIESQTWHAQNVGGNVPSLRDGYCTVGIRGRNNVSETYEVRAYFINQSLLTWTKDLHVWWLSHSRFQP